MRQAGRGRVGPLVRRRFQLGWALAWALASVILVVAPSGGAWGGNSNTATTVFADRQPGDAMPAIFLCVVCAIAGAIGAVISLSAVPLSPSARRLSAIMWAALGAGAVIANMYLASHPGPDWLYESITAGGGRRTRSPGLMHVYLTLPVAGALGGLLQSFATKTPTAAARIGRALVWMLLWSAAFLVASRIGVIAIYLLVGAGGVAGILLGGGITGCAMGTIASFSPGLVWQDRAIGAP